MNEFGFVVNDGMNGVDAFGLWKRVQRNRHVWEAEEGDTLRGLASKSRISNVYSYH